MKLIIKTINCKHYNQHQNLENSCLYDDELPSENKKVLGVYYMKMLKKRTLDFKKYFSYL